MNKYSDYMHSYDFTCLKCYTGPKNYFCFYKVEKISCKHEWTYCSMQGRIRQKTSGIKLAKHVSCETWWLTLTQRHNHSVWSATRFLLCKQIGGGVGSHKICIIRRYLRRSMSAVISQTVNEKPLPLLIPGGAQWGRLNINSRCVQ